MHIILLFNQYACTIPFIKSEFSGRMEDALKIKEADLHQAALEGSHYLWIKHNNIQNMSRDM